MKYFTYVNHTPLLSHPVYLTIKKQTHMCLHFDSCRIILRFFFLYCILCQRLRFANCLINKWLVDWLIDWLQCVYTCRTRYIFGCFYWHLWTSPRVVVSCVYVQNGASALLMASEQGHVNVVKILLQNYARVDVFDEVSETHQQRWLATVA